MKVHFKLLLSLIFLCISSCGAFAQYTPIQPEVYNFCAQPTFTTVHNTWYIDVVHGNDSTGNGSQATPWKNLQTVFTAVSGNGPFLGNPIQPGDVILLENGSYGAITIGTSGSYTNQTAFLTISADLANNATAVNLSSLSITSFTKLYFNGLNVSANGNGSPALVSDSLIALLDQGASKPVSDIIFNMMNLSSQANVSSWTASQWISNGINGFSVLGSGSGANAQCIAIQNSNIFNVIAGIQMFASSALITNNNIYMTGSYGIDACGPNGGMISKNLVHDGNEIGGDVAPTETSTSCNTWEIFNNIVYEQSSSSSVSLAPSLYDGINNFDSDITNFKVHNNLVITDAPYGIGGASLHNGSIFANTVIQNGNSLVTNGNPGLWLGQLSTGSTSPSSNVSVTNNFAPALGNSTVSFFNSGVGNVANNNLFPYNAGNPVIYDYNSSGVPETLAGNSGSSTNYTQATSGGVNKVDQTGGYPNQIRTYNPGNYNFNVRPVNGSLMQSMSAGANGFGNISPSIFPQLSCFSGFACPYTYVAPTPSDPTANVLPSYDDANANWKMAGLQSLGGISAIDATRTNCTTAQAGETLPLAPSGVTTVTSNDDYNNIQKAINNCPANTIINLAAGSFTMDESEFILMNKSVTLRGNGNCGGSTNHAYCNTTIVKRNGVVGYSINLTCGTSLSTTNACDGTPVVMMSANGRYNNDWSGCHDNTTGGTQDGNTCAGTVASLTADAAQGATTVHVNTTTPFSVGMWVLIDEDPAAAFIADPVNRGTTNPKVWASPDMFSAGSPATGRIAYLYFSPSPGYGASSAGGLGTCTGAGCPGAEGEACDYAATCFRPVGEIHLITAVNSGASTITFDSPLTVAMRQSGSHNAHVYYPTGQASGTYTPFLQKAGLEYITVGRGDDADVSIIQCAYCWTLDVDAWGWAAGAVNIQGSARIEVNTTYGYDCFNNQNNGNEYAYSLNAATTEAYITNSISRLSGKSMVARAGGAGSVVAYNYMDDNMYEYDSSLGNQGTNWIDLSANASHFPGSHHVLFEGNHAVNGGADMTHGSGANYMTYFRNHLAGYRTPFTDPTNSVAVNDFTNTPKQPGNVRAFGISSYNYWHALVGNVLGTAGYSTAANGWDYNTSSYLQGSGYNIFETIDEYTQNSNYDPNLNFTSSSAFIFQHGNYDYYHGSIADWHAGYSETLPKSFYLTSTPSFFTGTNCSYPFPWVTPTAGSQLQTPTGGSCSSTDGLPAKARWDAGTPFVQP